MDVVCVCCTNVCTYVYGSLVAAEVICLDEPRLSTAVIMPDEQDEVSVFLLTQNPCQ